MFPSPGGPRVPVCREKRGNLGFHRSCHSCEHANSLPAERGPRRLGFPGGEGSGGGVGLAPLAPASPPLPPSAPSPRPSSKQEAPLQPRLSPRWAAVVPGAQGGIWHWAPAHGQEWPVHLHLYFPQKSQSDRGAWGSRHEASYPCCACGGGALGLVPGHTCAQVAAPERFRPASACSSRGSGCPPASRTPGGEHLSS